MGRVEDAGPRRFAGAVAAEEEVEAAQIGGQNRAADAASDGASRTYAACGGVDIAVAIGRLSVAEGKTPTVWDLAGAARATAGTAVIVLGDAGSGQVARL